MFPNRSTTMMYSNATSKYVVALLQGSTALHSIAPKYVARCCKIVLLPCCYALCSWHCAKRGLGAMRRSCMATRASVQKQSSMVAWLPCTVINALGRKERWDASPLAPLARQGQYNRSNATRHNMLGSMAALGMAATWHGRSGHEGREAGSEVAAKRRASGHTDKAGGSRATRGGSIIPDP